MRTVLMLMLLLTVTVSSANAEPSQLSELFYQLQVMQQEVSDLRGLVEEQSNEIRQLKRDQVEQYRNMDQRLLALSRAAPAATGTAADSGAGSGAGSAGGESASSSTGTRTSTSSGGATTEEPAAGAPISDEQADYNAAYALISQRKYDEALSAFNRLIVEHPGGELSGNALYWLGELYLVKEEAERARAQFIQVLDLYPKHAKIPDTLFKLGVTYDRLGDSYRALEYLNQVRAEHPGHKAAVLAADYAKGM